MKRTLTIILFTMIALMSAMAQQPGGAGHRAPFNPEEFQCKMDAYIREKAGLTQEEADKIFPLFHDMKKKQMEIGMKVQKLKRQRNRADNKDADYRKIIEEITTLNIEQAKIEQAYYNKMCKVTDAKKVYELMRADDAFHRELIHRMGPGNGERQGRKATRDGMPHSNRQHQGGSSR